MPASASLSEQGLQLSPSQKQEVFGLLVRRTGKGSSNWRRRPGQLVQLGPMPLSLDLSAVGRVIRYRYQLVNRPHQLVESTVLTPDDARVITVYPTDQRTVEARRAGGRWLFLNR